MLRQHQTAVFTEICQIIWERSFPADCQFGLHKRTCLWQNWKIDWLWASLRRLFRENYFYSQTISCCKQKRRLNNLPPRRHPKFLLHGNHWGRRARGDFSINDQAVERQRLQTSADDLWACSGGSALKILTNGKERDWQA